jgi:hypothetical protein
MLHLIQRRVVVKICPVNIAALGASIQSQDHNHLACEGEARTHAYITESFSRRGCMPHIIPLFQAWKARPLSDGALRVSNDYSSFRYAGLVRMLVLVGRA